MNNQLNCCFPLVILRNTFKYATHFWPYAINIFFKGLNLRSTFFRFPFQTEANALNALAFSLAITPIARYQLHKAAVSAHLSLAEVWGLKLSVKFRRFLVCFWFFFFCSSGFTVSATKTGLKHLFPNLPLPLQPCKVIRDYQLNI